VGLRLVRVGHGPWGANCGTTARRARPRRAGVAGERLTGCRRRTRRYPSVSASADSVASLEPASGAWNPGHVQPPSRRRTLSRERYPGAVQCQAAALREVLADAQRGRLAGQARSGATFGQAVEEWLRYVDHDRGRTRSTVADYTSVARGSLLPAFGSNTPLEEITSEALDAYRSRLLAEGRLSNRTIQKQIVLLGGILKRAQRAFGLASNPALLVERPPVHRTGEFSVLTPAEVAALARAAESEQDAALYTTAAFTGLRLGELRALRWSDVDFSKRLVHVRRGLARQQLGHTKSHRVRSVADRPGGPCPRRPQPPRELHRTGGPRLRQQRRQPPRSLEAPAPLLPGPRPRWTETASLSRLEALLRDARRPGLPALGREGLHGPRGHSDHDDLRPPRPRGRRGPPPLSGGPGIGRFRPDSAGAVGDDTAPGTD
jgi:hypothetical protein